VEKQKDKELIKVWSLIKLGNYEYNLEFLSISEVQLLIKGFWSLSCTPFFFFLMNFYTLDTRTRYFSILYNTVICPYMEDKLYIFFYENTCKWKDGGERNHFSWCSLDYVYGFYNWNENKPLVILIKRKILITIAILQN